MTTGHDQPSSTEERGRRSYVVVGRYSEGYLLLIVSDTISRHVVTCLLSGVGGVLGVPLHALHTLHRRKQEEQEEVPRLTTYDLADGKRFDSYRATTYLASQLRPTTYAIAADRGHVASIPATPERYLTSARRPTTYDRGVR